MELGSIFNLFNLLILVKQGQIAAVTGETVTAVISGTIINSFTIPSFMCPLTRVSLPDDVAPRRHLLQLHVVDYFPHLQTICEYLATLNPQLDGNKTDNKTSQSYITCPGDKFLRKSLSMSASLIICLERAFFSIFCVARLEPGSRLLPDTPCFLDDARLF